MTRKPTPQRKKTDWLLILVVVASIIGVILFVDSLKADKTEKIDYNVLVERIENGSISTINHGPMTGENNGLLFQISGRYDSQVPNLNYSTFELILSRVEYDQFIITLNNYNETALQKITVNVLTISGFNFWGFLVSILPLVISVVFIFVIFRNMSQAGGKQMDFSKSRAKLSQDKTVTFKDVAGAEEEKEELVEVVDFLKNPKKYTDMGARIPKGVLLSGRPGTGKTLLAKAVAGEANVPFFSISGSDFVELYVGVGAGRVRDLFKTAKENSPCIVFIDEIDAVGRQRGAGLGGGNDEREQTLNQLLVEMDGFNPRSGIIIMAATNRPDVLDPALQRPGRFDRQITLSLPDLKARVAILGVHARNKKIDPQVKFEDVARRIPGFSGADIENLLNEAALLAARNNRVMILVQDIDEAVDRVMMGPAKTSRKYNEREKKMVAYHEAGHAIIGIKLDDAAIVHKITIIPRGNAGGYNLLMPKEETFLQTKKGLLAQITSYLGGRVAEELFFDTVSTGAYGDFQSATKIARAMVTEYGMSSLGPIQYETANGNVFLGRDYLKDKNFSDQVAHEIDKEVRKIITECYDKAKQIITENSQLLELIAHYVMEVETLNKEDIDEIVNTNRLGWWEEEKEKTSSGTENIEN